MVAQQLTLPIIINGMAGQRQAITEVHSGTHRLGGPSPMRTEFLRIL